jgi:hypothetical protein
MAETYILNFEANTSKAVKSVDKLDDSIKDTSKNTQDLEGSMSGLDSASGGMITKFKGLKSGLKNVITGFKSMRVAIIATGIGALVLAITAVGAAFTSTEEGQNKFNKIMGVLSSITGNLIDILATLGEKIISVFEDPKQALIDFKDAFIENITNRFTSALETLGFLGSAIKKVFQRDFKGAMEDAKSAGSSYVDSLTGVKNTLDKVTESVKELSNELIEEAKIAAGIADQRAKADKLERQLLVDRATANRDRAKLLEQAVDRENFSTKQRIEFLEEAGRLEEEITNKEIIAAKLRYDAKVAENELAGSKKADLEEQAQLEANLINLETAKLTKAKEVTSQIIALRSEEAAALKAIDDQAIADQVIKDQAELDRLKGIEDEKKKIIDDAAKFQQDKDAAIAASKQNLSNIMAGIEATGLAKTKAGQVIYKAIALTQIAMDSAIAISKASTLANAEGVAAQLALPGVPGIGTIARVLSYASTVAQVGSNIASAKKLLSGGGKSSVGGSQTSTTSSQSAPAQAPAFNIVGQGAGSQIASALGDQQQTPVQAYVVSQDITTAQSLENGIISGATLGS